MPISLYVKTHAETGLKYLGQTKLKDPHKYTGSGLRWIRHLEKHGYNYTTEILAEVNTMDELATIGMHYSELWNIVESNKWANLMPENGSIVITDAMRLKTSNTMKGRPARNKGLKQVHAKHATRSDKGISRGPAGESPLKGRKRPRLDCPHCGKNIDEVNFQRYHGTNCKFQR